MVGIANNSFVSVKVSKELIKEHTTVRRKSSDYSGGSGDYSGSGGVRLTEVEVPAEDIAFK